MYYTALKGWNFQTETFNTVEAFFNPTVNSNHNLTSTVTLRSALTAYNKVFNREFLKEWYASRSSNYGSEEQIQIINALITDESIPTAVFPSIRIECDYETRYNEEEDQEDDELTGLYVEMYRPTRMGSVYLEWGATSRSFRVDEDYIPQIKDWIKEQWVLSFNLEQRATESTFTVDAFRSFCISDPCLKKIWGYHFGKVKYYRKEFDAQSGQSHVTETTCTAERVIEGFGPNHSIEVHQWASPWSEPIFYWCLPLDLSDRTLFHRLQQYTTDVTRFLPLEMREPNELSDNLYGVELEVSSSVGVRDIVDATEIPYCVCKSDSTITGRLPNKFEIVSGKATIKRHKKSWNEILSKVGYDKFDVTRNTNNGMHVHVDMDAFKNKDGIQDSSHQRHFAWFFCNPINRPFHQIVGERDDNSINAWAPAPQFPQGHKLSWLYSNLMSYIMPPYRGIVNMKRDRNNNNYVTIEVRLFKGIVSLASIWKNLEYVDSIFNFTSKQSFQSNTLSNYLHYLNHTPSNQYATLKEFINRIDLQGLQQVADLKSLLWGIPDPEKAIHQIRKHNIPIDNSQLPLLNEMIEGAKFALKNGQLVVVETNRSTVHDLDMVLHNKLARKGALRNVSHPRP